MSFPGAAAAALAGLPLAYGYYGACIAGALGIAGAAGVRTRRSRARESAAIGTAQALALGFLLLSIYGGVLESLKTLLFGLFLGISTSQVLTPLILAVAVLALLAGMGRPLLFASLDPHVAHARGCRCVCWAPSSSCCSGSTRARRHRPSGRCCCSGCWLRPRAQRIA
jgi:zinc/manganese transport system permease protein